MLTEKNYNKGIELHELLKYNIERNSSPLFRIVLSGLATRLLNHEYSATLTEKEKEILQKMATI